MTRPPLARAGVAAAERVGEGEGVGEAVGTTLDSSRVRPLPVTELSEVKSRVMVVPLEEREVEGGQ